MFLGLRERIGWQIQDGGDVVDRPRDTFSRPRAPSEVTLTDTTKLGW
jgi:hypothetical protein